VWVLKNGTPSAVSVVVGASDGQRTEIVNGDLKEGQGVIVDSTTGKQ
jgi:HlyD family secretion protein